MYTALTVHDLVEQAVQRAQAQAEAELSGLDKLAGVELEGQSPQSDTYIDDVPTELDYAYVEKVASTLEHLTGQNSTAAVISQRLREKLAAKTQSQLRGGKQLRRTQAKGTGKQATNLGGKERLKPKSLVGIQSGKAKASIRTSKAKGTGKQAQTACKTAQIEELKQQILGKVSAADPTLSVWKSGEGPGAEGRGHELAASHDRLRSMTKRDAKSLVLGDLAKLLKHKAFSKNEDPVVHGALRSASKAGVKIAGAAAATVRDRLVAAKGGR